MPLGKKARPMRDASGIVVSIYSKPDCHLCEEAKAQLIELQKRHGFRLEEVDITRDARLLAEYEARLPLIWVNGCLACKYRVDEKALVAHMRVISNQ